MLLRRITKHVTEQNWFAVFIDFLIVVVGVFIGIQVANWNEARGEFERGRLLEMRLVDEFLKIESDTANTISLLKESQEDTRKLSQLILAGELSATDESLLSQIDKVDFWLQPVGTSATYNEIIAQGDTDLLRSSDLRSALLDFNSIAKRHLDANLVFYQSVEDDAFVADRIRAVASVPVDARPEAFSDILEKDLSSLDLYQGTVGFIRVRDHDLNWHRAVLNSACQVLIALEQPCVSVSSERREAVK